MNQPTIKWIVLLIGTAGVLVFLLGALLSVLVAIINSLIVKIALTLAVAYGLSQVFDENKGMRGGVGKE